MLTIMLAHQPSLASTTKLSLTSCALPPLAASHGNPGFIEELARIAFKRAGVDVDVTSVPTERSLINVNAGLDDGDIFHVAGLEQHYPNLMRIPEKVLDFEFVAYSTRDDIQIRNWADLKPYSVAYVTGWKTFDRNVTDVMQVTKVPSVRELLPLLDNGRADVVLLGRWQGDLAVRAGGYKARRFEPSLAQHEMFMYLNRKHAELVPKVAAALVAMKTDGTYQALRDAYLRPLDKQ